VQPDHRMDLLLRGHRNIRLLVQGSLYALPFAEASFGLLTCNMVLEHLESPARALAEIARCLRTCGDANCFASTTMSQLVA